MSSARRAGRYFMSCVATYWWHASLQIAQRTQTSRYCLSWRFMRLSSTPTRVSIICFSMSVRAPHEVGRERADGVRQLAEREVDQERVDEEHVPVEGEARHGRGQLRGERRAE